MKRWLAALLPLVFLAATTEAAPHVSPNIYEWVQSSARANYFFNKRVMHYELLEGGVLNPRVLIVPTLQTYDDVAIADVVAKRRWRGESLEGYDDLVGEAGYLRIDLAAGTSTLERSDDLDGTWSALATTFPKNVTVIKDLPEKSLERKFLEAILAYERGHRMEIAAQTKKTLTADDLKRLEEHEREDLTAAWAGGAAGAAKETDAGNDGTEADRKGGK
nr:hypothetical protein [uncultured Selenomonas sp.]